MDIEEFYEADERRRRSEEIDTASLYLGSVPIKNPATGPDNGHERDIFILGFDPVETPFNNPAILAQQDLLERPDAALYDTLSSQDFGIGAALVQQQGPVKTEIEGPQGGQRVQIDGTFEMGATFAADGNLLVGKEAFLKAWPDAREDRISLGLLTLKPGADPATVAAELRTRLPNDVQVLTFQELIDKEKHYWDERTPIGFVIGASMIVSLIVGAVIVYQILYTDVTDHLPEYATLKSIGFADGYFIRLVLQESIILSVLGFLPGLGLAAILYWLTRRLAHMPTYLNLANVAAVLGLSLLMCLVAGALATRKLRKANPADIF